MFCKYCGREITDDSKFCEFCGNMIQRREEPAPERVPDIPVSIGEPIFKEVIVEPEEAPAPVSEETKRVEVAPPVTEEPETEQEVPEKKGINKGLLWGLIGGGTALIAGIIVLLVILLGGKTVSVDATQYVDFKVSGYDGYGIAICEMDWDGLEVAAFGEYPSGSDSKSRAKQLEYKANAVALRGAVTLEFEKLENVKVGDKLTATFKVNQAVAEELGLDFGTKRSVEYTVKSKDLSGSSEIDLLAEFVEMRFEGLSGKASAVPVPKERETEYSVMTANGTEYTVTVEIGQFSTVDVKFNNVSDKSTETVTLEYRLDKETELKVGDKVTLSLDPSDKEALMAYGLVLKNDSAEYTVEGLEGLVMTFEEIDEKILNNWKDSFVGVIDTVVNDNWGYYFHGGNDIRPTIQTIEDIVCKQSVLITEEEHSELYLIYSATVADDAILADNFGLPRTYHFAVRLRDLRISAEGEFMSDKVLPPAEGTDDIIGAYLDYDELVKVLTQEQEYVLEIANS